MIFHNINLNRTEMVYYFVVLCTGNLSIFKDKGLIVGIEEFDCLRTGNAPDVRFIKTAEYRAKNDFRCFKTQ